MNHVCLPFSLSFPKHPSSTFYVAIWGVAPIRQLIRLSQHIMVFGWRNSLSISTFEDHDSALSWSATNLAARWSCSDLHRKAVVPSIKRALSGQKWGNVWSELFMESHFLAEATDFALWMYGKMCCICCCERPLRNKRYVDKANNKKPSKYGSFPFKVVKLLPIHVESMMVW